MINTMHNGRRTLLMPNVANTMKNAKLPCQNVANTVANCCRYKANGTRKGSKKQIQNLRPKKNKNYAALLRKQRGALEA
jgi:hypothetical protein